jgi:hypothetical protein
MHPVETRAENRQAAPGLANVPTIGPWLVRVQPKAIGGFSWSRLLINGGTEKPIYERNGLGCDITCNCEGSD